MESVEDNEDENIKKKALRKEIMIYFLIEIILCIICIWDRIVDIPRFPKCFLFLTQIDLYSNMIYYLLILYHIFNDQTNKKKKLFYFFNFNFCVSFVVFTMYWSMLLLDKKTLYKNDKEKIVVPTVLNLLLHGGVFAFNLFVVFFNRKKKEKEKSKYVNINFYLFFTIFYIGMLYLVKNWFNIKVYPFIYGSFVKFIIISICGFITCLIGHYIFVFLTKVQTTINDEKKYKQFEMH